MEDQLVGWRLGQLEVSLTKVEEQLILLRDDMVKRTSVKTDRAASGDWTLRFILVIIAAANLYNALAN